MIKFYNILFKKSTYLYLFLGLFIFLPNTVSALTPNDLYYSYQEKMFQQINAPQAWDKVTKTKAIVAVIDIGVEYEHPNLLGNIWINSKEILGNGIDDDNNGFIDDIYGWNFVENNPFPKVTSFDSKDFYTLSHGTSVAGLIGAVGNNLKDATGLSWEVKIMPIKAIGDNGLGQHELVVKAIEYAVDNGADIINISFMGDYFDQNIFNALKKAYNKGVLIVAAAGNNRELDSGNLDEHQIYPICFDKESKENWILGVASVDQDDRLSSFSNYGSCVDIVAPGENIFSLEIPNPENNFTGFGGNNHGTSFSTPLVSGAAALIKGIQPDWTARELIDVLLKSADDITEKNPDSSRLIGYGRLNVGKAIELASLGSPRIKNKNICLVNKNRLYCYDIKTKAYKFLTKISEEVKTIDWIDQKYISVVTSDFNENKIKYFTFDGQVINTIKLDDKYSHLKILEIDNSILTFLTKYSKEANQTKFATYNFEGKKINEFFIKNKLSDFLVTKDRIYLFSVLNNKLIVQIYDFNGKLIKEMQNKIKLFSEILDVKIGYLWSLDSEQLVILTKNNKQRLMHILDLPSNSFFSQQIEGQSDKIMILDDFNNDRLEDLLFYNLKGGEFNIYTAKGRILDQKIELPKFK